MQELLEGLNDKQYEAVVNTEGPCLVIAGAGSGKTKVLTHKIAYLMGEKDIKPWNILAITFTNKAANEMKERVDGLVEGATKDMWIGTFHSICVRILRRFIDRIGFDHSFVIFDTSDQRTLIKECLNNGVSFYFKYSRGDNRTDNLLIYASDEQLGQYAQILKNIEKHHPEIICDHGLTPLSATSIGWFAYGIEDNSNEKGSLSQRVSKIVRKNITKILIENLQWLSPIRQ